MGAMAENRGSMDSNLDKTDRELLSKRGYTLIRHIGEGSCAQVFLVEYRNPGNLSSQVSFPLDISVLLACKVIDTYKMPKDLTNKFLAREIDIISKLRHPNIIHLHSILQRNSKFMIFMRNAEYGNLCDFIIMHGSLKEKQARAWMRQILTAMCYLHALDIVHRDIKCENILITKNHNVKLGDFGFSRFITDLRGKKLRSTTFCGSLAYAAPELIKGIPYDGRISDMWSLGVVLYIMLNQAMPFNSENLTQLWVDQMSRNYRFRTKVRPQVSDEVVDEVARMLDPDVKTRAKVESVLHSAWMAMDPRLPDMTHEEKEALATALAQKDEIRSKSIKRLTAKTKTLSVVSRERYEEGSDKLIPVILANRTSEDPSSEYVISNKISSSKSAVVGQRSNASSVDQSNIDA